MVNNNCPVCKSRVSDNSVLFILEKDHIDFEIVRCRDCRHVYTSFKSAVELQSYYDEKDYEVKDTRKTIFHKIQEHEYLQVIRRIKDTIVHFAPSLLDFGSGKGLFMSFAHSRGFRVKGVETSLPRARYARQIFDLEISTENYVNGTIFNTRFDVITVFHVLEHLQNPKELLHNLIEGNLVKDGVAIIEVPNFGSWQSQWSGKYWLHLDVPRHFNHFTPEILRKITAELNLKIIREEYFSLHLGIIGMIQTIWSWFGYRGFLIGQLKQGKTLSLLMKIALTLPFAFLTEGLAALLKRGGVIRYYVQINSDEHPGS